MALRLGLVGAAAPFELTLRTCYRLLGQGAFREAAAFMDAMAVVAGSEAAFSRARTCASSPSPSPATSRRWLASRSEYVAEARTYRRRRPAKRGAWPTLRRRVAAGRAGAG